MVDVNQVYNIVNFELNKSQSGNTLSPSEYNTIAPLVNVEFFKWRYGLPEQYQPGRPSSAITLDVTQKIMDDMRAVRMAKGGRNLPALPIDVNGWADYPSDFVHISSVGYGNVDVEVLRDDFKNSRLDNSIKFPTYKNPICVMQSDYIEFFPKDLGFVNFTYLRMPATPVWGYTIVNDEPVYNVNTSTQFEWPSDCLGDIAAMVMKYAATNLRDGLALQTAEQRKEKGV